MTWLRIFPVAGFLWLGGITGTWAADASEEHQARPVALETPYRFGVFPYLTPLRMEAIYAPVGAALSQAIDHPVHFRTASHFELFFERLKVGHYDIALIQPFWYVKVVDRFGYLPLARIEEPLTSLIMVLDDNPINSIEELRGKVVATPPAFVPVTRMAIKALEERGLIPGRDLALKHFKSIDSCFQQVVIGAASACVTMPFAPRMVAKKMNVKLRVLLTTPGIPNLTFVIHPRVAAKDRERILQAILSWRTNDSGRTLLQGIGTVGFVPARGTEYDVIRALIKEAQQQ